MPLTENANEANATITAAIISLSFFIVLSFYGITSRHFLARTTSPVPVINFAGKSRTAALAPQIKLLRPDTF